MAGGSGLVGTHLTRRLLEIGAEVRSSFNSRAPAQLAECYDRYDFTRFEDCLRATQDRECVFLCAVQSSGVLGMKKSPSAMLLPNLEIHAGILEACQKNKVKKVIWISSSTVYQEAFFPIKEHELDLNKPTYSLYQGVGWLYRYIEQLGRFYHEQGGLQVGIIRTTSIYGPHDQFDDAKSHVVPALIKRALRKEDPFVVWGREDTVRDFIYVEDLVDALVRMANDEPCSCEPLNVCNGQPMTIRNAVDAILLACGHAVVPCFDSSKPTAVPYRALDMSRFEARYGKGPRTSFADGIRKTIDWYLSTQ